MKKNLLDRRKFLGTAGVFASGAMMASGNPTVLFGHDIGKKRLALVGTGIRAAGMWTKSVLESNLRVGMPLKCSIHAPPSIGK